MIILAYDLETITYLEGNGDGNGLIRVAIRTWSDFNLRQLSGRGRYIAHMVQPTEEFYQSQYPSCPHEVYEGNGVCTTCGTVYDWEATLDPWAKGIYRLTENVTPRVDAPYHAAAAAELSAPSCSLSSIAKAGLAQPSSILRAYPKIKFDEQKSAYAKR
jgi:hypothetical protein